MPSEMDSWARRVQAESEVPAVFRETFTSFAAGLSGFPYTVYAPPDIWGSRKTNAKLIAIYDGKVLFVEKARQEIRRREFLLEDILYVECGAVLLYSWLKIAVKSAGQSFTVMVEFNSVVKSLFEKAALIIRVTVNRIFLLDSNDASYLAEKARFDYLGNIDFGSVRDNC
ncbi:MAG: hypothetical protein K6U80_18175 [Firmicutes bacterium]|nr:hypothetical protein [Bacillota bacterium]